MSATVADASKRTRISRSLSACWLLSVKNVPDALAEALRHRAEHHHRSLQGELLAILEDLLLARHPDLPLVTLDRKLASRTRLKTRRAGDGSRGDEKT
jgi:plasmid stability protein